MNSIKDYFEAIDFNQPLTASLIEKTIEAINSKISGEVLRSFLSSKIPVEAFVFQEVIAEKYFYQKYCRLLDILEIETPSTRSSRDMLSLRILVALYGDDEADKAFTLFRENRKALKQTDVSDPELYDIELPVSRYQANVLRNFNSQSGENIADQITASINNLPADKLRSILSLTLSGNVADEDEKSRSGMNHENDADINELGTDRSHSRFRLEIALARIQSYYPKARKYSGEFEDDLEDIFTELETACRGQMAPDSAKPELFRLALSGRALTFYKTVDGSRMQWGDLRKGFMSQFMSRTKKAEISAELDSLHISTLRSSDDSDRQALDKLINRLDKLSLMGNDDDKRDDAKIWRLHAAIAQEK